MGFYRPRKAAIVPGSAAKRGLVPSEQQRAFLDYLASGGSHAIVGARAGCGKTATIEMAVRAMRAKAPGSKIGVVMFNTRIKDEALARFGDAADIMTLNSYGWRLCMAAFRGCKLDKFKVPNLIRAEIGEEGEARDLASRVNDAVSKCKFTMTFDPNGVQETVDAYGIDCGETEEDRAKFIALVVKIIAANNADTKTLDFNDQLLFPVLYKLGAPTYDYFFIDEAQDLSRVQLELIRPVVARTRSTVAVGDDMQAIYTWRGADANALANVRELLGNCPVFPLTVTRRCARAIVDVARNFVPDFAAHEGNSDGEVVECDSDEMMASAGAGSFILSRTNAPLLPIAFAILRDGRKCNIVGRSIGDGLKFLIKRSKANEPGALCTWIDEWEAKECERLAKKNAESAIQVVQDRAAMVRELALECVSVKDILARIDALFSDEVPGDRVMLSTVHRVKGDERETVYLLRDTFDKVRAGMKKRGRDTSEEDRVMYVAVTRAARRLVYTETPKHEE